MVLSEYSLGFKKKMTLTNKRLIVQQGEGFFRVTWKNEAEIPLEEIEEANAHVESSTSLSTMKLRLKNGNTKDIRFKPPESEMTDRAIDKTAMLTKVKAITERWVNAITSLISDRRNEEAIKSAVECNWTTRGRMGSVHKRDR